MSAAAKRVAADNEGAAKKRAKAKAAPGGAGDGPGSPAKPVEDVEANAGRDFVEGILKTISTQMPKAGKKPAGGGKRFHLCIGVCV
jgi:hypothetical protein